MNFKKMGSIFLLIVMIIITFSLFGGNEITKQQVKPVKIAVNDTQSPQISEEHIDSIEVQEQVNGGCILVMIILICITSLGGIEYVRPE